MRPMICTVFGGAFALLLMLSTPAVADRVYHSERLPFVLTDVGALAGHPELRSGQVVNIHPNGPVNGALERYMINGAKPNTSYQVVIQAFNDDCAGDLALQIRTVVLQTNKQGNAHGQAHFSRQTLDEFKDMTFGVQWTLVVNGNGVVAYQTRCTVVTID